MPDLGSDEFCAGNAADIPQWAARHQRSENDAWHRYALVLAARCLARDAELAQRIVLAGGMSLWLAHGLVRTPADVDIIVRSPLVDFTPETIRQRINRALIAGMPEICPADWAAHSDKLRSHLKLRLNAQIAELPTVRLDLKGDGWLDLASLEFCMVAKWLALGTPPQPVNPRPRSKDVYDLCFLLRRHGAALDLPAMGRRTLTQAALEDRGALSFHEGRAPFLASGYDAIREPIGPHFIPFEDAWRETQAAASAMGLPTGDPPPASPASPP